MDTDSETNRPNWFAVMWDCHGLEAVEQLPDERLTTFALLKNEKPPTQPNLMHWQLRARFNTQRHYEIYLVSAEHGIESNDIVAMFESNPQVAADTIRRIGQCYYSDRVKEDQVVIR